MPVTVYLTVQIQTHRGDDVVLLGLSPPWLSPPQVGDLLLLEPRGGYSVCVARRYWSTTGKITVEADVIRATGPETDAYVKDLVDNGFEILQDRRSEVQG